MRESTRKWLAETYDQRGSLGNPNRRTGNPSGISFHNINKRECETLRKVLEGGNIHTTSYKDSQHSEGYYVRVNRQKDILLLCVYIYPYLQDRGKRERIVNVWRKLGWCICNDVR